MKKNLLFVAMLFATLGANAQITWTMESSTEGVAPAPVATSTGVTAKAVEVGTGLKLGAIKTTYKDPSGTATPYIDGTIGLVQLNPTNETVDVEGKATTEEAYRTLDGAVTNDMVANFYVETTDPNDLFGMSSVSFDAARVGTDAVRINARLYFNEDPTTATAWLITPDNYDSVDDATDGVGGHWEAKESDATNWTSTVDAGYVPDRDDASKTNNGAKCITHFNIPIDKSLVPDDAYAVTLQIAVYGISSNKNALLHNVTINGGVAPWTDTTGIGSVEASADAADSAAYNLAGQKVGNDYKGIVVKNGKKFIQK